MLALGASAPPCSIAAVLAVLGTRDDGAEPAAAASQATKTTTIVQQDLVESEEVDGTLGYSDSRTVTNHLSGTVTWTPKAGTVVKTNHPLYEVDGKAVYLLEGSYPVYRTMGDGLTGRDVRELEDNLRAARPRPELQDEGRRRVGLRHHRGRQALAEAQGSDAHGRDRARARRLPARLAPHRRGADRGRRECLRRRGRDDDGADAASRR